MAVTTYKNDEGRDTSHIHASQYKDLTHVTEEITASGEHTIFTPATGKRVRLHALYITTGKDSTNNPLITVQMGDEVIFKLYGSISIQQLVTGPIDAALHVDVDVDTDVAVTVLLSVE